MTGEKRRVEMTEGKRKVEMAKKRSGGVEMTSINKSLDDKNLILCHFDSLIENQGWRNPQI